MQKHVDVTMQGIVVHYSRYVCEMKRLETPVAKGRCQQNDIAVSGTQYQQCWQFIDIHAVPMCHDITQQSLGGGVGVGVGVGVGGGGGGGGGGGVWGVGVGVGGVGCVCVQDPLPRD